MTEEGLLGAGFAGDPARFVSDVGITAMDVQRGLSICRHVLQATLAR